MSLKPTNKQDRFCHEYIIDFNGTQAALRTGYSERTAREQAARLLSKAHIQERINQLKEKGNKKVGLTREGVLEDLILARSIALGEKPHHVVVTERNPEGSTITTSKEINKTDLTAFMKLNELTMKHLGMFEKDNEQKKPENTFNIAAASNEELEARLKIMHELDKSKGDEV